MVICEREKCAACYACVNKCPKQAIYMDKDKFGNLYTKVNEELCVNCGLCKKVCPINNELDLREPKYVYAAWAADASDRKSSTSGGVATVFSKVAIENDGVVFGSALDDEMIVRHIEVSDIKDVERLRGSKYVQSEIGYIYKRVKARLMENKEVIFIGTPCQVSGLKCFLGKNNYKNLITIDLVCHGTPSSQLLKDYLSEKGIEQYDSISFRDKQGFNLKLKLKDKEILNEPMEKCEYYKGFMNALFYRENCYSCPYAGAKRCSDITIGDFWGLGKEEKFEKSVEDGVSLILINTEEGEEFFNKCNKDFYYEERSLNEAVQGNSQLRSPSLKHKNYDLFRKIYINKGIRTAVKRSFFSDDIVEFVAQSLRGNQKLYLFVRKIKRKIFKNNNNN